MRNIILSLLASMIIASQALAGNVIVFGIDETGSYDFRKKALTVAQSLIRTLKPGDAFFMRRITGSSYQDSASIFTLELPVIGDAPQNLYDAKANAAWKQKAGKADQFKAQAIQYLETMPVGKASKTDIWGFFAAASDRLNMLNAEQCKIYLASDMRDNCKQISDFDLVKAEVVVLGFESGTSAKETMVFKKKWAEDLSRRGAGSVQFMPIDMVDSFIKKLQE
jgi:hypothetical protein